MGHVEKKRKQTSDNPLHLFIIYLFDKIAYVLYHGMAKLNAFDLKVKFRRLWERETKKKMFNIYRRKETE